MKEKMKNDENAKSLKISEVLSSHAKSTSNSCFFHVLCDFLREWLQWLTPWLVLTTPQEPPDGGESDASVHFCGIHGWASPTGPEDSQGQGRCARSTTRPRSGRCPPPGGWCPVLCDGRRGGRWEGTSRRAASTVA